MTTGGSGGDFEGLARQYWDAWGQAMRRGGAQAGAGAAPGPDPAAANAGDGGPGWQQAVDWWRQLLPDAQSPQANDTADRFQRQAGDWLGLMQQVASRFAGRDTDSAEVAQAWREAVEGQGDRLLQWTLGLARAGGIGGADPGLHEAAQWLENWRRDSAPWLDMPGLGLGRNHQGRWQTLARAQQEYQQQAQAYAVQLKAALDQAFKLFEGKLAEHEGAGAQLTSARAMFDLWIEAAEEAYSAVALSEEFQRVYGAFANAQMRLRASVQQEVEQVSERLGMPTRSEMDAAHKRIAELERLVRRMAAKPAPGAAQASAEPAPKPKRPASRRATPAKPAAPAKATAKPAKTAGARRSRGPGGGSAR